MRLYIAEKPSMGREIAKCLKGPVRRCDGYLETGEGVVTWLFGHILRQAEPDEYDPKYKRWRAEDLPIIPKQWKLFVDKSCEKQFAIVKGLIDRCDEIVHGGDPDREGQLLVDEVLDYLGNKKPVKRILLNALDEASIKKANANLRENRDFFNLKQSALARARADWLIGMNLSRAYTLAARRAGHDKLVLPIGRVKTPTLSLVVRREREIENFKPVDYYTIKAEFNHENGSFAAQWKPKDTMGGLDSENRLLDKSIAEAKLAEFQQEPLVGLISAYQKTKKQEPQPLPFSLSSLQVLAGKMFGYAPQVVLDTAQKLYEKKLTTYPRSDCEYLPTNQFGDAGKIIANLVQAGDERLAQWTENTDTKSKSRAWNDKKISAHHAIIPTTVKANMQNMSAEERNLYFLIARGYIAQFYPVHLYDQTKVEVTYKEELFTASGRTERDLGWKVMYQSSRKKATDEDSGSEAESDESNGILPVMKKKDNVTYEKGNITQRATKPPVRFTESTLLAGMKEIHKYVKNPEAKKQLKDVYGIGTEATRATIIEDLVKRKFMQKKGKKKYLVPTPAAYLLVDALPDEMTYPDSTAIWEDKLHSMSEGDGTLEEFLQGQIAFTQKLCGKAGQVKLEVTGENVCPRCHSGVLTQRKGKNGLFWGCSNYPKCRMTCNDKDGKPDLEDAKARIARRIPTDSPVTVSARQLARQKRGNMQMESRAASAVYSQSYAGPSAQDMADLDSLFTAADYEAQMAADMASFATSRGAVEKRQAWGDKPRFSASPLEKAAKDSSAGNQQYLCPKCREGHLRLIRGKNGSFWGCTNYPRCTATFDDSKGAPVF
ncbi:MAG: DNA topoisomerase 3 [Selenomonas sp.]|uniref:DNA topoisomerase III n=1 Tax=Selenomonas sp. TaxID=2053611 RepID=UPI0025F1923F|nr:DNA topoisomerase 3 [Selenomonas sp.]MCR5758673.1 DNA topoisomerase 3 [Selenomonas sp.]